MACKAIIQARGLSRLYQLGDVEVKALRNVDLTVERGEFVAIAGASGSGKSTLMAILGCLDRPSAGSICSKALMSPNCRSPRLPAYEASD